MSLLWSFVIISKLTIDNELYKKKWFIYLELIIALAGVYLYRKKWSGDILVNSYMFTTSSLKKY